MEGEGFWPNKLSRILAETGLCKARGGSPRSGLAKRRAPESLAKSGQGERRLSGFRGLQQPAFSLVLTLS